MINSADPPILDISILIEMYGDSHADTIIPALVGFRDEATDYTEQLQQAAQQQDVAEIARLSHSLKGMCGLVGACQFMLLCQKIEDAARQWDQQRLTDYLPTFEPAWRVLLAELKSNLRQLGHA